MEFKDRKGQHLNRKKLKVISQSPTELIVDMERFDNVEEEGTKIDAAVFNAFQNEITTANSNASNALSIADSAKSESALANTNSQSAIATANTAVTNSNAAIETANEAKNIAETVRGEVADRGTTVYVGEVAQPSINFVSDPQSQIDNKLEKAKSTATTYSADDLLVVQKSGSSENYNISLKTLTSAFLDAAFPIGSIYMSVSPTNPGTLFGGNWEAYAQGRTIFGAGTSDRTFGAGTIGGESNHTLTINEIPSHTHTQNPHTHTGNSKNFSYWFSAFAQHATKTDTDFLALYKNADNTNVTLAQTDVANNTAAIGNGTNWGYRKIQVNWNHTPSINNNTATNNNTGGGSYHNNLPPYIVTYAWKRIS